MKEETLNLIRNYKPYNQQEEQDKKLMLDFLGKNPDAFYRTNRIAHMTASAWVVNRQRTKVLMAYHNIYCSWSWLGGHCDGDEDVLGVAIREVKEESSLKDVVPVGDELFSLESLTVDGHEKNGLYVSSHLHLNLTFLLEADDRSPIHIKADENKSIGWFSLDEALKASTEPWFVKRIYTKLNEKLH